MLGLDIRYFLKIVFCDIIFLTNFGSFFTFIFCPVSDECYQFFNLEVSYDTVYDTIFDFCNLR